MRTSIAGRLVLAALLIVPTACSKGGGSTGPGGGSTHLKANIDGTAWTSTSGSETAGVTEPVTGTYSIVGAQPGGGYAMVISLFNIGGTGTYPLGVGTTAFGGTAQVTSSSGGWSTPLSGAAGTVTITKLTSTRIAGTFSYTADASTGSATGSKVVTGGDFDLAVNASSASGPLPDNAGSRVSATIDDAAWNAATIAGSLVSSSGGVFTLVADTDTRDLVVSLNGVTAPGTYTLGTSGIVTFSNAVDPTNNLWSSQGAGGSGTVTISDITSTRIQGTFSATLAPAPGTGTTGTVTITNGTFDLGRTTSS